MWPGVEGGREGGGRDRRSKEESRVREGGEGGRERERGRVITRAVVYYCVLHEHVYIVPLWANGDVMGLQLHTGTAAKVDTQL